MRLAIFVTVNKDFIKFFYLFFKSLRQNYPDHPELLVHYSEIEGLDLKRLEKLDRV